MTTFSTEILTFARQIRKARDKFDLLIADGDSPNSEIKDCEKEIDVATLKLVRFLREQDR